MLPQQELDGQMTWVAGDGPVARVGAGLDDGAVVGEAVHNRVAAAWSMKVTLHPETTCWMRSRIVRGTPDVTRSAISGAALVDATEPSNRPQTPALGRS